MMNILWLVIRKYQKDGGKHKGKTVFKTIITNKETNY